MIAKKDLIEKSGIGDLILKVKNDNPKLKLFYTDNIQNFKIPELKNYGIIVPVVKYDKSEAIIFKPVEVSTDKYECMNVESRDIVKAFAKENGFEIKFYDKNFGVNLCFLKFQKNEETKETEDKKKSSKKTKKKSNNK